MSEKACAQKGPDSTCLSCSLPLGHAKFKKNFHVAEGTDGTVFQVWEEDECGTKTTLYLAKNEVAK